MPFDCLIIYADADITCMLIRAAMPPRCLCHARRYFDALPDVERAKGDFFRLCCYYLPFFAYVDISSFIFVIVSLDAFDMPFLFFLRCFLFSIIFAF